MKRFFIRIFLATLALCFVPVLATDYDVAKADQTVAIMADAHPPSASASITDEYTLKTTDAAYYPAATTLPAGHYMSANSAIDIAGYAELFFDHSAYATINYKETGSPAATMATSHYMTSGYAEHFHPSVDIYAMHSDLARLRGYDPIGDYSVIYLVIIGDPGQLVVYELTASVTTMDNFNILDNFDLTTATAPGYHAGKFADHPWEITLNC